MLYIIETIKNIVWHVSVFRVYSLRLYNRFRTLSDNNIHKSRLYALLLVLTRLIHMKRSQDRLSCEQYSPSDVCAGDNTLHD